MLVIQQFSHKWFSLVHYIQHLTVLYGRFWYLNQYIVKTVHPEKKVGLDLSKDEILFLPGLDKLLTGTVQTPYLVINLTYHLSFYNMTLSFLFNHVTEMVKHSQLVLALNKL